MNNLSPPPFVHAIKETSLKCDDLVYIVYDIYTYNSVGAETNAHNSQEAIIDIKI